MIPRAQLTPTTRPAVVVCPSGWSCALAAAHYVRPAPPGALVVSPAAIGVPLVVGASSVPSPLVSNIGAGGIALAIVTSTAIVRTPTLAMNATGSLSAPVIESTVGIPAPAITAAAPPAGFYLNGSTNPKLKAMLARGYGTVVEKSDSTGVGVGGGTTADANRLTGARVNRVSSVQAGLFRSAGVNMRDSAIYCDHAIAQAATGSDDLYRQYDPRLSGFANPIQYDATYAGGGYITINQGYVQFDDSQPVDSFEVIVYGGSGNFNCLIDGAAPASITRNGVAVANNAPIGGFGLSRYVVKAAGVGTHSLAFASNAEGNAALSLLWASVRGFNSTAPSIEIHNHSINGSTAANHASSGNGQKMLDMLALNAPDLTIISLGINDITVGASTSAYTASLQTIITAARAIGDVLLEFPHPWGLQTDATVGAYNSAAKALAASNGIAFFSRWENMGSAYTPVIEAQLMPDKVHPLAALYADFATKRRQCIQAMAA